MPPTYVYTYDQLEPQLTLEGEGSEQIVTFARILNFTVACPLTDTPQNREFGGDNHRVPPTRSFSIQSAEDWLEDLEPTKVIEVDFNGDLVYAASTPEELKTKGGGGEDRGSGETEAK